MDTHAQDKHFATDALLTPSETRIACGYAAGLVGKEIADACDISYNTVVKHTQNIYEKTGIGHNTNALTVWFLTKNFDIDMGEIRRRLGALLLLVLIGLQSVMSDPSNVPVRRAQTRVTARARRTRRDDSDTLTIS